MNRFFTTVLCGAAALLMASCGKEKEKEEKVIAVTSVSISQSAVEMKIGETVQLKATVLPADATDKHITWTSSKQSVAIVTSDGLVSALAEGSSTITATSGGKTAQCEVTVKSKKSNADGGEPEGYNNAYLDW